MCWGRGWDEAPNDPCIYCKGSGKMKDKVVKGEVKKTSKAKEPEKKEADKKADKKSVPTMKELLAKAKELDLKGYSKLNKTKLKEMIDEAKKETPKKGN